MPDGPTEATEPAKETLSAPAPRKRLTEVVLAAAAVAARVDRMAMEVYILQGSTGMTGTDSEIAA